MTYRNPVWPGYLADPFVLRRPDGYYAYGTGGPGACGGDAGRAFPVLRSRDLARWEPIGCALESLGDPDRPAYWAPEVAERDGVYYLYFSAGGPEGEGQQLRVATSDCPEGPFRATGRLLLPGEPFSIDASPFRDPQDGRWYLFFARDYFDARVGTGVAVVPLEDMTTPGGDPVTVVRAQADWQIYERNRTWYGRTWDAWHTVEGPSVVAHAGRYYCFYSGGLWKGPDYGVGCAVADHPMGPYRDDHDADGPSVLRGIPGKVLGPGHNSVVVGPDGHTEYLVYHAWDAALTARRMCIDPLVWTPEGPRCDGPSSAERPVR